VGLRVHPPQVGYSVAVGPIVPITNPHLLFRAIAAIQKGVQAFDRPLTVHLEGTGVFWKREPVLYARVDRRSEREIRELSQVVNHEGRDYRRLSGFENPAPQKNFQGAGFSRPTCLRRVVLARELLDWKGFKK